MNTSIAAIDRFDGPPAPAEMRADTPRAARVAAAVLRGSTTFWFGIAALGQLMFASYVVIFYGRAAVQGHPEIWNKVLQAGYIPGDTFGNLVLASHLLFGAAITLAGTLQPVPQIRRRWPRFHRWNGRFFLVASALAACGGLIMIWTRKTGGDLSQHTAISINALIILFCAGAAWQRAVTRRFDAHREWALRLWLAANGGWFFRIGLMAWIVANHGPAGFDPKTFTGPFITFLSFAQYLLPLAVLQVYFVAQRRGAALQWFAAGVLCASSLLTLGGIVAASALLWLPHL